MKVGRGQSPRLVEVLTEGIRGLDFGSPAWFVCSVCPFLWPHYNKITGLCKTDLLEHNSPEGLSIQIGSSTFHPPPPPPPPPLYPFLSLHDDSP